jgi:glycosyltransferase involved in cell wall biosynthesis
MHIGILCDYGFTLLPKAGIGVFVYNLIDGLLTLTPRPMITLLTHPGDQEELEEWAAKWGQRVTILPPLEQSKTIVIRLESILKRWYQKSVDLESNLCRGWDEFARRLKQQGSVSLKESWKSCRSAAASKKISFFAHVAGAVFWLMLLGIGSWIGEVVSSLLLVFLIPTLAFPIRIGFRVYGKLTQTALPLEKRIADANCDVWLVPYPGTAMPILAPHVLVIFDMVFRHVPEVWSAPMRTYFEHVFAVRAREATLIYCGSNFVKDHDLIPSYPFAAERIRVFRLAPPQDNPSGSVTTDLNSLLRKHRIGRRFLFYPAALRAHKNHAMLVRALNLVRQKDGFSDLELVFTGEDRQSSDLSRLVRTERLERQVHFLGVISRQEVLAFYQYALMVPLPSLHEGYGLPLLEALQQGCPVACADIPAFRELLENSSEGVLFFDPRDPVSIANAIVLTITRRQEFRERQRQAYQGIAQRDWHAVAKDFLRIFEEAQQRASGNQRSCPAPANGPAEVIHHAA